MRNPIVEALNTYFFPAVLTVIVLTGILAHQASLIALNNPTTRGGGHKEEGIPGRLAFEGGRPLGRQMPGFRDMQTGKLMRGDSVAEAGGDNVKEYAEVRVAAPRVFVISKGFFRC